jgi:hypothetical protein
LRLGLDFDPFLFPFLSLNLEVEFCLFFCREERLEVSAYSCEE